MKNKLNTLISATTKKDKLLVRTILCALGVFIMGFGMAVIERLNFGTDPFTCMNNGFATVTNSLLGTINLAVSGIMLVFVIFSDISGLGIGTIFNMLGFGYIIDFFRFVFDRVGFVEAQGNFRYILLFVMLFVFILAVSLYLAADLGSAPYDALPAIISKKLNVKFVFVRMIWDGTAVMIGFLLGSEVGITTLVCALFVGPASALVRPMVDKILS